MSLRQALTSSAARTPLGLDGKPLVMRASGIAVADELLVRFGPGVENDDALESVRAVSGLFAGQAPLSGYHVVRFSSPREAAVARDALRDDPRIVDVAYNHVFTGSARGSEVDATLAPLQWNLHAMTLDPNCKRPRADGVTIAILDTGIAYEDYEDTHGRYKLAPDLQGVEFASGYDFINLDGHPNDDQRHGTHIAGVIAASRGVASIAPGATIMPIKVLDRSNSGTEIALAEGIRYAVDHGADIINMSLTFPPTYFPSRVLQAAVDHAAQHGVVMVAAAGNHGAGLVAYPAAFRDVIAVGASELPPDYVADSSQRHPWSDTLGVLQRAAYSNHSFKLDVLAPAGSLLGDANGDGLPEAVLAQTHAKGNPTEFGYVFYAGTSQAAAQVSGVAALLLAENADLEPRVVRALITETAYRRGYSILSSDKGRGDVRARRALSSARSAKASKLRPGFAANVTVTLHDTERGTTARAHVEILDENRKPVPRAAVYGLFTGAAFQSVTGTTDARGLVELESEPLAGQPIVAFQVDAVTRGTGNSAAFDRPRGFTRIDSLSLELLAMFGGGIGTSPSGIGTSPSGIGTSPSGIGTSPSGIGTSPSGIGTSPSGIGTSPSLEGPLSCCYADSSLPPITIAFDPALFAGSGYRPTLLLANFSWGMATSPMAVAVDESWFLSQFPRAAERRVVSRGRGYGGSALQFDASSFPEALSLLDQASLRIPLIVYTFTTGIGTSPSGIGTSPSGIGTSPSLPRVDLTYSGLSVELASEYERLLDAWLLSASGIGTSPSYDPGLYAFDLMTWYHLWYVAWSYYLFGASDFAMPAAAYGEALSAAAMPTWPVVSDTGGLGAGSSALSGLSE
ncbi:MAG: S8 family serine peptidase [Deltaproteobacteria bacterium]|nr:S8 family serine peptidase [Deltaproteobacteria bacterium]